MIVGSPDPWHVLHTMFEFIDLAEGRLKAGSQVTLTSQPKGLTPTLMRLMRPSGANHTWLAAMAMETVEIRISQQRLAIWSKR